MNPNDERRESLDFATGCLVVMACGTAASGLLGLLILLIFALS